MKTREEKRKEAADRQEAYSKLTKAEKLARIESRPGKSTKERRKIEKA